MLYNFFNYYIRKIRVGLVFRLTHEIGVDLFHKFFYILVRKNQVREIEKYIFR